MEAGRMFGKYAARRRSRASLTASPKRRHPGPFWLSRGYVLGRALSVVLRRRAAGAVGDQRESRLLLQGSTDLDDHFVDPANVAFLGYRDRRRRARGLLGNRGNRESERCHDG